MAKVMTLNDLKLSISRNGFDLSKMRQFSAKSGELLPIRTMVTLPDDNFDIELSHFSRTTPLLTPAYTRFKEYFDVFFVPFQTIWHDFPTYWQSLDNQQQKAFSLKEAAKVFNGMPYMSTEGLTGYLRAAKGVNNSFGFDRSLLSAKLLEYLGYGNFYGYAKEDTWAAKPMFNERLSPFPLCAYQKFYNDHYRFEAWEKSSPWTWNLDFVTPSTIDLSSTIKDSSFPRNTANTLFDMRYVNFERDLYFGVYPNSQLGASATVAVGDPVKPQLQEFSLEGFLFNDDGKARTGDTVYLREKGNSHYFALQGTNPTSVQHTLKLSINEAYMKQLRSALGLDTNNATSQFTVLQLRMAQTLQRYREVLQTGDQDFKATMEKIWHVSVPAYMADLSYRVGGYVSDFNIQEVTNTNLTADNRADLEGKGVGSSGSRVHFDASKYGNVPGILMIMYYNRPLLNYSLSRAENACKLVSRDDFANPAFDKLGMEQVHLLDMCNTPELYAKLKDVPIQNLFIGYAPRYIKWKTDVDDAVGIFKTPAFKPWVATIDDNYLLKWLNPKGSAPNKYLLYDYNIFKVNPSFTDDLFVTKSDSTINSDRFLVNFSCDVKAVRSLDYNGMPY